MTNEEREVKIQEDILAITRILRAAGMSIMKSLIKESKKGWVKLSPSFRITASTSKYANLQCSHISLRDLKSSVSSKKKKKVEPAVVETSVYHSTGKSQRAINYITRTYSPTIAILCKRKAINLASVDIRYEEIDTNWANSVFDEIGIPREFSEYTVTFTVMCPMNIEVTDTFDSKEEALKSLREQAYGELSGNSDCDISKIKAKDLKLVSIEAEDE